MEPDAGETGKRPRQEADAGERVARIPRGRGFSLRRGDMVRIGMFATLLVCVLVLGRPCADGMAGFVDSFNPPPDAAPPPPALRYERLTEQEILERFGGASDAGPAVNRPEVGAP